MHKPKIVFGMKVKARLHQKEVKRTFSQSFNLPTTASVLRPMTIMLHNFEASSSVRSNHADASRRKLKVEMVAAIAGAVAHGVVHASVNTTVKTFGAAGGRFYKYQGDSPLSVERVFHSRSRARASVWVLSQGFKAFN